MKHIRSAYGDYFGITVAGYPGIYYFLYFCCCSSDEGVLFLFVSIVVIFVHIYAQRDIRIPLDLMAWPVMNHIKVIFFI